MFTIVEHLHHHQGTTNTCHNYACWFSVLNGHRLEHRVERRIRFAAVEVSIAEAFYSSTSSSRWYTFSLFKKEKNEKISTFILEVECDERVIIITISEFAGGPNKLSSFARSGTGRRSPGPIAMRFRHLISHL